MTKEELRKKAEEYVNAIIDTFKQDVKGTLYSKLNQEDVKDFLISFYIDCAEPREKKIKHLEESLLDVTKKLVKQIKELEQQIEKMKCCNNCFYDCEDCNSKNKDCDKCPCGTCVKHNHWESRR